MNIHCFSSPAICPLHLFYLLHLVISQDIMCNKPPVFFWDFLTLVKNIQIIITTIFENSVFLFFFPFQILPLLGSRKAILFLPKWPEPFPSLARHLSRCVDCCSQWIIAAHVNWLISLLWIDVNIMSVASTALLTCPWYIFKQFLFGCKVSVRGHLSRICLPWGLRYLLKHWLIATSLHNKNCLKIYQGHMSCSLEVRDVMFVPVFIDVKPVSVRGQYYKFNTLVTLYF